MNDWNKINVAKISNEMYYFFKELWDSDYAIVCKDGRKIIGFFRWDISKYEDDKGYLYSHGTFVEEKYRRTKIAQTMWKMAYEKMEPKAVILCVSSRKGLSFGVDLKNTIFKNIDFEIESRCTEITDNDIRDAIKSRTNVQAVLAS